MPLPPYVPPGDDEPLDAVQQALVKLWVKIITDEMLAELNHESHTGGVLSTDSSTQNDGEQRKVRST